jgi:hypothetical protein
LERGRERLRICLIRRGVADPAWPVDAHHKTA